MAMKSTDSPRRLYTRKGRPFVNFQGYFWGPPKALESEVNIAQPVTCEPAEDGKHVVVTQKVPKKKTIVENWIVVKIGKEEG